MYSSSSRSDTHTPRLAQNANEMINEAADLAHEAVDRSAQKISLARRQIRERPVQSALIALGAGYLLGKIF